MRSDPAGQLRKIRNRQLFRAVREERMLRSAEIPENGFQRITDHLPPLTERGLDHPDEKRLVAVEPHGGIASLSLIHISEPTRH